jgi:hypothetical protein
MVRKKSKKKTNNFIMKHNFPKYTMKFFKLSLNNLFFFSNSFHYNIERFLTYHLAFEQ